MHNRRTSANQYDEQAVTSRREGHGCHVSNAEGLPVRLVSTWPLTPCQSCVQRRDFPRRRTRGWFEVAIFLLSQQPPPGQ